MAEPLFNRQTANDFIKKEKNRYHKKLEEYGYGYGSFEKYKKASRIPVIIICVAMLFAYAIPIIFYDISATAKSVFNILFNVIWILLALDFVIRFVLAKKKKRFFVRNLLDFISIAIPQIRPLRLVRLITLFTLFRKSVKVNPLNELVLYTIYSFGMITIIGGLALADCERDAAGTNIHNSWDGLYSAVQSITLTGFGSHSPVTRQGEVIASILMIVGVILIGVTARIGVAFFMRRARRDNVEHALTHPDEIKTFEQYKQLKKNISKALDDEEVET
jgi:voltage-gated potassium channel